MNRNLIVLFLVVFLSSFNFSWAQSSSGAIIINDVQDGRGISILYDNQISGAGRNKALYVAKQLKEMDYVGRIGDIFGKDMPPIKIIFDKDLVASGTYIPSSIMRFDNEQAGIIKISTRVPKSDIMRIIVHELTHNFESGPFLPEVLSTTAESYFFSDIKNPYSFLSKREILVLKEFLDKKEGNFKEVMSTIEHGDRYIDPFVKKNRLNYTGSRLFGEFLKEKGTIPTSESGLKDLVSKVELLRSHSTLSTDDLVRLLGFSDVETMENEFKEYLGETFKNLDKSGVSLGSVEYKLPTLAESLAEEAKRAQRPSLKIAGERQYLGSSFDRYIKTDFKRHVERISVPYEELYQEPGASYQEPRFNKGFIVERALLQPPLTAEDVATQTRIRSLVEGLDDIPEPDIPDAPKPRFGSRLNPSTRLLGPGRIVAGELGVTLAVGTVIQLAMDLGIKQEELSERIKSLGDESNLGENLKNLDCSAVMEVFWKTKPAEDGPYLQSNYLPPKEDPGSYVEYLNNIKNYLENSGIIPKARERVLNPDGRSFSTVEKDVNNYEEAIVINRIVDAVRKRRKPTSISAINAECARIKTAILLLEKEFASAKLKQLEETYAARFTKPLYWALSGLGEWANSFVQTAPLEEHVTPLPIQDTSPSFMPEGLLQNQIYGER